MPLPPKLLAKEGSSAPGGNEAPEQRVDPVDGRRATFVQIAEAYTSEYSREQIQDYWKMFCLPCEPSPSPAVDFSILACATPDCPYRVHSLPDMGPYCCIRCFRKGSHGPDCEHRQHKGERRAARWWRSVPGTEIHAFQEERYGPADPLQIAVGCAVVRCASDGCKYRISTDPEIGAYCCMVCARKGPTLHGPGCGQAPAAFCARRAQRGWRASWGSEVLDLDVKRRNIPDLHGPTLSTWMSRAEPMLPPQAVPRLLQKAASQLPPRARQEDERIVACRQAMKHLKSILPRPLDFEVADCEGVQVWPRPLQEDSPVGCLPKGAVIRGSLGKGWLLLEDPPADVAQGGEAWVVVDERLAAKCLEVKVWRVFAEAASILWKGPAGGDADGIRYAVYTALDEQRPVPSSAPALSSIAEASAVVGRLPPDSTWRFRVVAKMSTACHEQLWGPWSEAAKGKPLEVATQAADDSFLDPEGALRGGCEDSGCLAWVRPLAILEERLKWCVRCGHLYQEHLLLDKVLAKQDVQRRSRLLLPKTEKFKVDRSTVAVWNWPSERGSKCGHFDRGDEASGFVCGDWLRLDDKAAGEWLVRVEERLQMRLEANAEVTPCVTEVTGALPPEGSLWMRVIDRAEGKSGRKRVLRPVADEAKQDGELSVPAVLSTKAVKDSLGSRSPSPVFVCGGCQSGAALAVELLGEHSALAPVRLREAALASHLATLLSEEPLPFTQLRREVLDLVHRWLQEASLDDGHAEGEHSHHGRAHVRVDRELALQLTFRFLDEVRVGTSIVQALSDLCSGLFAEFARLGGKRGVVCEGPARGRFLHALVTMYPRLRVIHCVRDGRDVACSRQQLLGGSIGGAAVAWAEKVEQVMAWGLGHPNQYVQLRYEDLLEDPAQELNRVLRFLQLPEEPVLTARSGDVAEGAWCIGNWRSLPKDELRAFSTGKVLAAMRHFLYPQKAMPVTMDKKDSTKMLLQKVRSRMCAELVELVAPLPPQPCQVMVVRTAKFTNERLSLDRPLRLTRGQLKENQAAVVLRPRERYQAILGFGGAFSESAAEVLSKLSPAKQERVISAYFRKDVGLGYEFGRVPMTSSDFSPVGNWTCCDEPDDEFLKSFSIERYRKAILPMLHRAREALEDSSAGPLKLVASPWSPPAWMKTNKKMVGGSLEEKYRGAWAGYFLRFAKAFAAEGLPLWAVTVQNEPENENNKWETCLFTAQEECVFIRDFLGPALVDAPALDTADGSVGPRLLFLDHNRSNIGSRPQIVYGDKLAERYVWGMAFHWYDSWLSDTPCFHHVEHVHNLRPEKHLIFTEAAVEQPPHESMGKWKQGERYARHIINDLNNWTEAWIDWNLLLDENGGPNWSQNYCMALIHADTTRDALLFQPSYYYMGHFSRYLRPGAVGIGSEVTGAEQLEATAFENPDGTTAVVVLNQADLPVTFQLAVADGKYYAKTWAWAPERSITTFVLPPVDSVPYAQCPGAG